MCSHLMSDVYVFARLCVRVHTCRTAATSLTLLQNASERPRFFARKNLPARSSGEIVVRVQLVEIAGPVRLDEVFSGRRREEVDVVGPRSAAVLPHFNELEAPR